MTIGPNRTVGTLLLILAAGLFFISLFSGLIALMALIGWFWDGGSELPIWATVSSLITVACIVGGGFASVYGARCFTPSDEQKPFAQARMGGEQFPPTLPHNAAHTERDAIGKR